MILYGLRLLVALLTFAFGVAAAWVFSSNPSKNCKTVTVLREGPVTQTVLTVDDAPKTRSCSLSKRPVEGGILNAKAVSKPAPVYPSAAKAGRITGTVSVRVEVDEGGLVTHAEAVSGPEVFRESAEEAALAARFSPTRLSGQPVKVAGYITYGFYDK